MIWCLRAPDAVDVIEDNLVCQLEPPSEGRGVPEWFAERATGFTAEQRAAIVAFLESYRARHEAHGPAGAPSAHATNALAYWTRPPEAGA